MLSIDHIISYVFFLFCAGYLFYLIRTHRSEIWSAFRGKNEKLDIHELAALYWFFMFAVLFFAELFLGKTAGSHIWYSLDTIFLIIVGGDKIGKAKNGKSNDKKEDQDSQVN